MWSLLRLATVALLLSGSLVLADSGAAALDEEFDDLIAEPSNVKTSQVTYEKPKAEYTTTAAPSYAAAPAPTYTTAAPSYAKRDQTYPVPAAAPAYHAPAYHAPAPAPYHNVSGAYDQYNSYSPWKSLPGSYSKESYGGGRYEDKKHHYSQHSVYASYLSSPSHMAYAKHCSRSYGQPPKISYADLNLAFADALHHLNQYGAYEQQHYKGSHHKNYSSAAPHLAGNYLAQQTAPIYFKEKEALFMEYASKYLAKHHCLTKLDAHYLLPQVKVGPVTGNPYGDNNCYAAYGLPGNKLHCRDSVYRTPDGSCNNLYHPYWGKAFVCHLRLVPPAYEDGISSPRITSVTGHPLPSARVISGNAHVDKPDRSYYTHLKMAYGQYVNHDLTFTAVSQSTYDGGLIHCCDNKHHHPQCFPIEIPPNDYNQAKYKRKCMNFVRSTPCPLCNLGPREQTNIATSFLDNGALYGSSKSEQHRLRVHKLGLLRTLKDKCGKDIMPVTHTPWENQCTHKYNGHLCFDAGDGRVNQHPTLQVFHTLWLRTHNHHATALYRVNPKWGDERLFQEARRLVVAQLQHITYNEYLPIVFGPTLMKYFDLGAYDGGYTRYEPYTDPTTWNDYASAACRFGHSQVASWFSMPQYSQHWNNTILNNGQWGFFLKDWFFNPKIVHECGVDSLMKGLLTDHSMTVDPYITHDLKDYLFKAPHEKFGADLPAFNIQRSRDHGLPPYHVYLKFCFGFNVYSWDDLGKFIPHEQLYNFKKVYKHPHDVELWPAGVSERKFPDADVGPTFACILGIQYYHLKFGDRYFYSHGHQTGSFSPAQLSSLRHTTTLSSWLCKHGDYMQSVQKHAFFPHSSYNAMVPCKSHPELNYNLWKDTY